MSLPKITIITPSFNQGEFLEDTILSVINQNYSNLEYIIIDGGSSDLSVSIIEQYADKIDFWVSEKDDGQSHALNKGFLKSTGDIITWINSDDQLMPGILNHVAAHFQTLDDDTGLIHGGVEIFGDGIKPSIDFGFSDLSLERYLAGMAFSQPGSFFTKSTLEKLSGVNENLRFGMDYEFFSRIALNFKIQPWDRTVARYRIHDDSKTVAEGDLFIEDWSAIFSNIAQYFGFSNIQETLKVLDIDTKHQLTPITTSKVTHDMIDEKKLFRHFLSHVLSADFRNGNLSRARMIANYLSANYPKELLAKEKDIQHALVTLSRFPVWFISLAKRFKTMLAK
ncbi:MAG: glycosyltransferase involved in cell wall biosynthesis [Psychroserpens sp.]|jgi:glycosyltransferase involved in cell wall biosynthesis